MYHKALMLGATESEKQHSEVLVSQVKPALPDGRLPEIRSTTINDPERLRARVQELETLCAEVYVAAVELGLPQSLLNRLWTVAAQGSTPHAWAVDLPGPAAPAPSPTALPAVDATDAVRGDITKRRVTQPELKAIPHRRRVMVVDDDAMMMRVLVRILELENFDLITAASGAEALAKLDQDGRVVDLLITDYAMPGMKGRELANHMRQRCPTLRVLYQTGFSDLLFEDHAELEEHSAFLEKPFTARGLREAARFVLFGAINPA